jgi:hypothetical protein
MEDLMWIGSGHGTDHTSFNPWMQERLFFGGLVWQLSSEM